MKKSLLSLAAVALMMSACTQDVAELEGGNVANYNGNVGVTAVMTPETRTAMTENAAGSLEITWVAKDAIGLTGEDSSTTLGENVQYTANSSAASTTFTCAEANPIKWGEGNHTFYAYYPYTAEGSNYEAVPASIPAVQEQSAAGNTDHLQPYSFLYASYETNGIPADGNIDLQFKSAFSVLELEVCSEIGDVVCESLIFRADDASEKVSASNVLVNLTDGSLDYSAATTSNQIKIDLGEGVTLNTTTPQKFYMLITPGHGGKRFSFYAVVGGKEVLLGNKGIPAAGLPAGRKAQLSLNIPAVDLSANGTANCYIVNKADTHYKFKANVKGNGYDPISGTTAEAINLDGATAEIFWAYKKTTSDGADQTGLNLSVLRNSVYIKGDYIFFKTPAQGTMQDGNLAIRVKDSKGNTMWSWHIWAVQGYDYEASAVDVTTHGMEYKIMDRNLGAFSNPAAIASPTQDDYAYAHGLYYQWGRKDPFLCGGTQYSTGTWFDFIKNDQLVKSPTFSIKGNSAFNYNDFIAPHGLTDLNDILTASIQNPLQFFTGKNWATSADNSNGQTEDWGKLWGNQKNDGKTIKTMYDPCPAGYTVATPSHFKFTLSTGQLQYFKTYPTWEINSPNDIVNGVNKLAESPWGMYFYTKGTRTEDGGHPADKTTVFLPRQRWVQNNGSIQNDNAICMYTNAPSAESSWGGQPYKAKIEYHGYTNLQRPSWTGAAEAACAFAVRCVSDKNTINPDVKAIDLSANGTANCYIVNEADTYYKIKADVKGNGYDPISGTTASAIDLTKATADIIWAYKKTTNDGANNTNFNATVVRNSLFIKDNYIYFKTQKQGTMQDGNLAIAVKDKDGNILWSWHIWGIQGYDYKASAVDVTTHGMNYKIMDRNLGAFTNPGEMVAPTTNDYALACGMLYQWGRKDPFLGGISQALNGGYTWLDFLKNGNIVGSPTFALSTYDKVNGSNSSVYNYYSFIDGHGLSDFNEILTHSIQNPLQFYNKQNNWAWSGNSNGQETDWGKLWGNQKDNYTKSVKTMYDPCPAGYTVASPEHFKFVISVEDKTSLVEKTATYTTPAPSWHYNTPSIDFDIMASCPIDSEPWGLYFYTKGTRTESGEPADKTTVFLPRHRWLENNGAVHEKIKNNSGTPTWSTICFYTNAPSSSASYGGQPYKCLIRQDGYVNIKAPNWHSAAQAACALPVRCVSENE